jgi:hypothetical protein
VIKLQIALVLWFYKYVANFGFMKADRRQVLGWQPMGCQGWEETVVLQGAYIHRFFWF